MFNVFGGNFQLKVFSAGFPYDDHHSQFVSTMSRSLVEQNVREIGYKNQILERILQRTTLKLIRGNNAAANFCY